MTTSTIAADQLARFSRAHQVLLTTNRRDGTTVGTPVHIAVAGNVAFVRTFDPSGKLKRMRRDHHVTIAPCTLRGRVTGEPLAATARILTGAESADAALRLAHKHPILHGHLIPWVHRRKGLVTTQIELRPA